MQPWQLAWHSGFAPQFTDAELRALAAALAADDPALLQGGTTHPPPLHVLAGEPPLKACALCLPAWRAGGVRTVGGLEDAFLRLLSGAVALTGDPGAPGYFLGWFDDTPRPAMLAQLLAEVELSLSVRRAVA